MGSGRTAASTEKHSFSSCGERPQTVCTVSKQKKPSRDRVTVFHLYFFPLAHIEERKRMQIRIECGRFCAEF